MEIPVAGIDRTRVVPSCEYCQDLPKYAKCHIDWCGIHWHCTGYYRAEVCQELLTIARNLGIAMKVGEMPSPDNHDMFPLFRRDTDITAVWEEFRRISDLSFPMMEPEHR